MKNIRQGLFETNSSSQHTLVVTDRSFDADHKYLDKYLVTDSKGRIHFSLDEYGWEQYWIRGIYEKIAYALTYAFYMHLPMSSAKATDIANDIWNGTATDDYEDLTELFEFIKRHLMYEYDSIVISGAEDAYIDHQSYFGSLSSFLSSAVSENNAPITLEEYVFNSDVMLRISNDNEEDYELDRVIDEIRNNQKCEE